MDARYIHYLDVTDGFNVYTYVKIYLGVYSKYMQIIC